MKKFEISAHIKCSSAKRNTILNYSFNETIEALDQVIATKIMENLVYTKHKIIASHVLESEFFCNEIKENK